LADLIGDGLGAGDRAAVLMSSGEAADPGATGLVGVSPWSLRPGSAVEAELPEHATHVFIVLDGRVNPVDQLEAWKEWLGARGAQVARVLFIVDCKLAERNPKLFAWFEACIHFSDVVLLNRREGVANKWIGDFRKKFEDKFYPCLFEFVKGGKVSNPALILAPVARRMSHVFDEAEWIAEEDEDEQEEGEEEVEMKPEEDPYLERRMGGRWVLELPDIAGYLPAPPR
jgi:hypothetical protein